MKLPTNIATKHRLRDTKICLLYANGEMTQEEIGKQFNISRTRVGRILYKNTEFLKTHKEWEKVQRVSHLKRLLRKHPENIGKKDTLDIIDQLKDETEGSKHEQSGRTSEKIVIIYHPDYKRDNGIAPTALPNEVYRL